MSLEQRTNLLGAWAIHCDTTGCHIEVLGISEEEVEQLAKAEGWKLDGATHLCTDCASGTSPMDVINEGSPQAAAGAQPTPERAIDEDESDDDAEVRRQEEERLGMGDAAITEGRAQFVGGGSPHADELAEAKRRRKAEREKPSKPYNFADAGDTVPDVTAKAEDLETPEEEEKRKQRQKRQRERQEAAKKKSKETTLAAMGGVNDMLDDFDGMFGGNNTWD